MDMKTRKNFKISLTIFTFLLAGLFVACQQGDNINEKVRSEVEELRDDLNELDENDSNFADKLRSELEDFEESMNDLNEDMNESGQQISMDARQAMNDLQAEARSLRMKLESGAGTGSTSGIAGNMRTDDDDRGAMARGEDAIERGGDAVSRGVERGADAVNRGVERSGDLARRGSDAISGDRTAQAQRDTSITDTTTTGEGLYGDNRESTGMMEQDIRSEFQSFRQNVNQWVDRLSASAER